MSPHYHYCTTTLASRTRCNASLSLPAAADAGGEVHDTGASSRCTGGCRRVGPGSIVSTQPPSRLVSLPRAARAGHTHARTPRHQWAASFSLHSLSLSLFRSSHSSWWCFGSQPPHPLRQSPLCVVIGSFFRLSLPSAATMLSRQTSLCNWSAPFLTHNPTFSTSPLCVSPALFFSQRRPTSTESFTFHGTMVRHEHRCRGTRKFTNCSPPDRSAQAKFHETPARERR